MIRLSLCNEVVRELSFEAQVRLAAAVGYQGLEVAPFTLAADPRELSAAEIDACRRTAERGGIVISGLHWLLISPEGLSITSAHPDVRRNTLDLMRRLVNLCAELGGTYVVHGSPAQRRLIAGDEAESRKRGIEAFAEAAREAERCGVVYCVEPLAPDQTDFVRTIAEAKEIVESVGSPALRTMVDCAAAGTAEDTDIPTLIARHVPDGMIAHVHFNDPSRRGPGEGALAFAPIVTALKTAGYDGWVGVEPFVYEPDGPACAARAAGYVRGLEEANP